MAKYGPVEAKVRAATTAATIVGAVVTVLNVVVGDARLLGALPVWVQTALTLVVPPLVVGWSGWQARHTEPPPQSE